MQSFKIVFLHVVLIALASENSYSYCNKDVYSYAVVYNIVVYC